MMKRKRHTEEQIIAILKEHEAGVKTADLCRKHGISEASFYNWKAKYGGLEVSEASQMRFGLGAGGGSRTLTGLRPTDFRTSYGLRRLVGRFRAVTSSWSGLYLHRSVRALGAARLVSTPSRRPSGRSAWLGIASEGFPRI